MLWINEGFVLDDAGNMLTTSYIDLRDEAERTVIRSLVKGCRREHALEDGETLLISKPERFREYGVELIRDEQEGFAREEHVAVEAETPQEAAKRRATADLNDALQLVGSAMKPSSPAKQGPSTRARCWFDDAAGDHNILRSTRVQNLSVSRARQHASPSARSCRFPRPFVSPRRPSLRASSANRHSCAWR